MAAAAQVAGQPGTVGASALHAEGNDLAVGAGPAGELDIAIGVGHLGQLSQYHAEVVEGHGDVEVLVGVDTHDDLASRWLVGDAGHGCWSSWPTVGRWPGGQDRTDAM
jgi:hypothetical protein